ncbi:MAG TPA: hypothetical protein VK528_03275 [Flavobacterium sp.]|nr:hypothetical protein [Flavobacterium sp.]
MDKTNVTVKIPGRLLNDEENFINIDESKLVERLMTLLRSRKRLINVSFQTKDSINEKMDTNTKVEILLSDDEGDFNYYED